MINTNKKDAKEFVKQHSRNAKQTTKTKNHST